MSYKKNIEDTRESASIKILEEMVKKKFFIDYCDPYNKKILLNSNNKKKYLFSKKFKKGLIKKYDLIVIATDHDKYDYNAIKNSKKIIVDLRGRYKNLKSKYIYQL